MDKKGTDMYKKVDSLMFDAWAIIARGVKYIAVTMMWSVVAGVMSGDAVFAGQLIAYWGIAVVYTVGAGVFVMAVWNLCVTGWLWWRSR